jgi:hypothetical protein
MDSQGLRSIFFLILSLIGAIMNALILLCMQRNPLSCFRNSSSYLVAHQAFSDLITSMYIAGYFIAMFCDSSITDNFSTVARIFVVLSVTGFIALFLVSLDRFLAIRFPIRYRIYVKPNLVVVLILPIWLYTSVMILLIIYKPALYSAMSMFLVVFGGILVFIKLCLHCLAFWTIKKKGSVIQRNTSQLSSHQNQQMVTLKRESRFLFTVFLITVVVLVSTVPFLSAFHLNRVIWSASGTVTFALYWSGVILGPSIYFIRLNNYRTSLKMIICC